MKKTTLIRCALALCGLIPLVSMSPASADMLFVFAPTASGGTKVTGSGSGLADRPDGIASNDWDIQDFMTNFLLETYTDVQTGAETVAGTFTNVTTGVTENIISFDVDRDGGLSSDNDLDFDTANTLTFAFNDEFSLQLTAIFEPGTLPFSQLIPGNHVDVGRTQGAGIAEESFGISTVKVLVPEPGSISLMLGCIASLGLIGRRR